MGATTLMHFEKSGEISGPVCGNGGHCVAKVDLIDNGDHTARAHIWFDCYNSCFSDNLEPTLDIGFFDDGSNALGSANLDIDSSPARGINSQPTARGVQRDLALPYGKKLGHVEFKFRNRANGSLVLDALWFAGSIVLAAL